MLIRISEKMDTFDIRNAEVLVEYDKKAGNENQNMEVVEDDENGNILNCAASDNMIEDTALVKKEEVSEAECQLVVSSQNRMRIALDVLVRLVLPLCNGVARGWRGIQGVRLLKTLRNLKGSRQMLTNMLAYAANTISLSLSSVQVAHRIDPILKIVKFKKDSSKKSILANNTDQNGTVNYVNSKSKAVVRQDSEVENCVTLNVLAEPPPGMPIRADIIFIHGLHGSQVNTWKQGLWNRNGKPVEFERPPRPPIRPPKRPRYSQCSLVFPSQNSKRARLSIDGSHCYQRLNPENYEIMETTGFLSDNHYESGEPEAVDFCDSIEYKFPTFRLRLDENRNSAPSSNWNSKRSEDKENNNESNSNKRETDKNNNNSENTETTSSDRYSYCWPGDWLPIDCPGVRVIAVNYTTDPYLWRPVWVRKRNRSTLTERARQMADMLIEKRVGHGHPIVWVGHSKGGLFIKQILLDAWESGRAAAAPLWRCSRGVFFYSVPHRGSALADFNLPFLRQSIELVELQTDCQSVLELHRRFVTLYQSGHLKIDVFSFVETALTLMSVLYLRIVAIDSADPGIGDVCGVHLDHREICKPRSRNCMLYTELIKMINKVC